MKYFLCLLLLGCATKPITVSGSFKYTDSKPEIRVAVPVRPRIVRPTVVKPAVKKQPVIRPKVVRTITPKLVVPAPVIFAVGRARQIPSAWTLEILKLCKGHRLVLTGSSSPDGKATRNRELAILRAANGQKAALKAGCPEGSVLVSFKTGGERSLSVEVLK